MAEGFNPEGAANYATFAANQCVKATDALDEKADNMQDTAERAMVIANEAKQESANALGKANTASELSNSASKTAIAAKTAADTVAASETVRVENEEARVLAEAKRAAQFAEILDSIQGAQIRILSSGEYDENGVPIIDGAPGTLYFVPIVGTVHNTFTEWAFINGGWEVIGTTNTTIKGIDTDTIDRIVAGETVAGDEVVKTTGLSYLWAITQAFFAPAKHDHSVDDITGDTLIQYENFGAEVIDLNHLQTPGVYSVAPGAGSSPESSEWLNVYVAPFDNNGNFVSQIAIAMSGNAYSRLRVDGYWRDWRRIATDLGVSGNATSGYIAANAVANQPLFVGAESAMGNYALVADMNSHELWLYHEETGSAVMRFQSII